MSIYLKEIAYRLLEEVAAATTGETTEGGHASEKEHKEHEGVPKETAVAIFILWIIFVGGVIKFFIEKYPKQFVIKYTPWLMLVGIALSWDRLEEWNESLSIGFKLFL